MILGFLAAVYLMTGAVVAAVIMPLQKRRSGKSPKTSDRVLAVIGWPLELTDWPRLLAARHATYVPPFEERASKVPSYLAGLAQHRRFDSSQVRRLELAYYTLGAYRRLGHGEQDEQPDFVHLLTSEHLLYLTDPDSDRIVKETKAAWAERREEKEGMHSKGMHVFYGMHWQVYVHTSAHETLHDLPDTTRSAVIRELIAVGNGIDRYVLTDTVKVRERITMKGPLPCLIVGEAAAVVVEPDNGRFYILGILSNFGD